MTPTHTLEKNLNNSCITKCNKQKRSKSTENDICIEVKSVVDNLPVRCVGEWAIQKIYLLNQYFGIFAPAMKNKWEINYIEICSGPGRCVNREIGEEFNGTALSIIKHQDFQYLHKALFFDFDPIIVNTLNERITLLNATKAKAFIGDYYNPEDICENIKKEISPRSLNLILIDPTDCSVPFSMILQLKKTIPNIDFIINVATGSDYNRNIKNLLLNQDNYKNLLLKYSRFLGSSEFFSNPINIDFAEQSKNLELRNAFRETYTDNLKKLGYEFFGYKRIKNLYDILFASANKRGIEFWNKANKYKFDGQSSLNF